MKKMQVVFATGVILTAASHCALGKPNGCSVPNIVVAIVKIDKNQPAGAKFSTIQGDGACDYHDNCYVSIGASKATCDAEFLSDMQTSCAAVRRCKIVANMYYLGVKLFGKQAFRVAQEKGLKKMVS